MIRKLPSGKWQVDLRTDGRGSKRIRKSFNSKAEAKRFEAFVLGKRSEQQAWNPSKADNRTLKQLIKRKRSFHDVVDLLHVTQRP